MEGQSGEDGLGSNPPDHGADYENAPRRPEAGSSPNRGHGDGGPAADKGDKKPVPSPRKKDKDKESNQGHVGQDDTGTEKQDVGNPVPKERTKSATRSLMATKKAVDKQDEERTSPVVTESNEEDFVQVEKPQQSGTDDKLKENIDNERTTSENSDEPFEMIDHIQADDDAERCHSDDDAERCHSGERFNNRFSDNETSDADPSPEDKIVDADATAQSNAGEGDESDSDGVEVVPEEQSTDANKSFKSIQPPANIMVASVVDEGIKEIQTDANKPNTSEKETDGATAMPETSTSTTEKKKMFTLKKLGKKYLIKCSSCPKPFSYTSTSNNDVTIDDEDNLLIDGDRCFTLMVVDSMVILDEIVDAGQTNTTPVKIEYSSNMELQDAATSVTGMPSTGNNNEDGQSPTINNSGEKKSAIKNAGGQSAATNTSDGQIAGIKKSGGQNAATKNSGGQNAATNYTGGQSATMDNAGGQNATTNNYEEGQNAASNDTQSVEAKGSAVTTVQQASDGNVAELIDGIKNMSMSDKSVPQPKHPEERIYLLKGQESSSVPSIHVFVATLPKSSKEQYYTFGCKKIDTYLRWMLIVKDVAFFKEVVSKLPFQQKYGFEIGTNNSALRIMAADNVTEKEAYMIMSRIIDVIVQDSSSYIQERIDCTREVYSCIQKSKLANGEILILHFDEKKCQLWMLYHPSIEDLVKREMAKKIMLLKLSYYFHKILNEDKFKNDFNSSFPTVEIYHQKVPKNDKVIITLRCQNTETLDLCKKWVCEYEGNIASLSVSYSDKDGCSAEILKEYLSQSISGDTIQFEVNGIGLTVWMWSSTLSQSYLPDRTSKARNCIKNGRVVKSLSLPNDQRHIVDTLSQKYGKLVQVDNSGDQIVVSGLCNAVDEIEVILRQNNGQQVPRFGSSSEKMGEPHEQNIDRGAEGGFKETESELKWNKGKLEMFACHSNMVMVTEIPKDKTEKDLENELIKSSMNKPLMVYLEGSEKALLISKDNRSIDVGALDARTKYEFTTKMALGNLSMNKDINWKKLDKGSCDKLENILKGIKVTVDKATNSLKAETTYQMLVAKHKMKQFFEDKEKECTIDGVDDIVWKITSLVCKQTIDGMDRKGCKIKYDAAQQKVFLPAIDKPYDATLNDLRDTIANMQSMEIQDVQLTPDEAGKCDNICKEMGDKCCIFDRENKTVYIYSDTFDKIQKFKTQFEIKIGRKKATARGRRNNATIVDVSSETQTTGPVSSPEVPTEPKDFKTKEGVKVMVYKANILSLDVDCIVNAANSDLNHGGGVARVIAKAAGHDFEQDCKGYIRRNKKLPVGQACSTTAGNLKYKCVIHTVGPQWWDYNRKPNGQEKCEDALRSAITSSIEEANRREMKSIAFPAISSAIFGVPLDICAKQYVKAVKEYSSFKNEYDLCEVHFIDVREETVRAMQDAFSNGLQPEEANRIGSDAAVPPSDTSSNQESIELPEPLMFEDGFNTYNYYFMGNSDTNLLRLQHVDLEQIKDFAAVVVPVNRVGACGVIGKMIEDKVHFKENYGSAKRECFRTQQQTGDILINSGYGCGFKYVLYAVYPKDENKKKSSEREAGIEKTVENILATADAKEDIASVVIPMFGIDSSKQSEVELFSAVFIDTYRKFCLQKIKKQQLTQLTVNVVCHQDRVYKEACHVFGEYVKKLKDKCEDSQAPDLQSSHEAGAMQPDKSFEVCVICMDTVTVPKTIDCGHTFCKDCIDQQFQYQKKCPTCGKACGIITGDQPYGTMSVDEDRYRHLPGYEGCGTIYISYRFNNGKQESHHPSPGKWYKGIIRTAYLPGNDEGWKVYKMLRVAFDRKLTFTIGNSRTTGQEGVITWNDIHHKTDHRHHTQFGYPDPTYLERVKDELAAKGITEEDIKDM